MWKRRYTESRLPSAAEVTRMPRRRLRAIMIGAGLALAVVMTGCATAASPSISLGEDTVLVDVRTPAEYAGGHLDGAINIDVQAADFDAAISDLDPDDEYVVYCQTGNRSAQAVAAMESIGLDVQDAGGISEAELSTGLAVVR